MPQNIRAFVPGRTFFFTVTLLERCGKLMMLKAGCATLSRPTGWSRPSNTVEGRNCSFGKFCFSTRQGIRPHKFSSAYNVSVAKEA